MPPAQIPPRPAIADGRLSHVVRRSWRWASRWTCAGDHAEAAAAAMPMGQCITNVQVVVQGELPQDGGHAGNTAPFTTAPFTCSHCQPARDGCKSIFSITRPSIGDCASPTNVPAQIDGPLKPRILHEPNNFKAVQKDVRGGQVRLAFLDSACVRYVPGARRGVCRHWRQGSVCAVVWHVSVLGLCSTRHAAGLDREVK